MSKKLKILVIRFSSIGDIILTTPILRCLKNQLNADIDFLTNSLYQELLLTNTNISDVFGLSKNTTQIIDILRSKEYDIVIDLQNNFKSLKIRLALGVHSFVLDKGTLKRYLLIYLGIDLLNNHIVDRYFKTISSLKVSNDGKGIDYPLSENTTAKFNFKQDYIAWCIGGTYEQKKLSLAQISYVISKIKIPVVFLGGGNEKKISSLLYERNINSKNIYDFCGETNIKESAYLMQNSKLVLTNDTGMMHIASAFDIPIVSFWGCTKPSLGFYPYMPNKESVNIIVNSSKRPCSKHGKYCRSTVNGCIKEIDSKIIYNTIVKLIK